MKSRIGFVLAMCCMAIAGCVSNESASQQSRADKIAAMLHEPQSDQVFVISHRGDWRNFPENSLPAIESVIDMGVDIVEIDLKLTKDSVLVLSHDKTIDRCTDGTGAVSDYTLSELRAFRLKRAHGVVTDSLRICTLAEALECCKDRILVNIDHGYDYYDMVLRITDSLDVTDQVLIKGKRPEAEVRAQMSGHERNMMYMPIIDILKPSGKMLLDDYMSCGSVPLAYELCWDRMTPEVREAIGMILKSGSRLWVNTIWGSLCGYLDDDAAFMCGNPAEIYDKVIGFGATMIQTDRPELLLGYLRGRGLHD